MPIFNEFMVLALIFAGICILGVTPVIMQVRTKNKPQRWNYKVERSVVEATTSQSSIAIVDLASKKPMAMPAVAEMNNMPLEMDLELSDYTPMVVDAKNVQLEKNNLEVSQLEEDALSRILELCGNGEKPIMPENKMDVIFDEIMSICEGEKTASLVTKTIDDLKVDEMSVIFGKYLASEFSLEWKDSKIPLSYSDTLHQDEGGYLLLKGMKLLSGEFRVISYDDPQNVEAGYAVDEFILDESDVG